MPLPRRVRGRGVELAHRVRAVGQPEAERGHVELAGIVVGARARSRARARRARRPSCAARRRRGAARRRAGRGRRRSARCRPRPGVWIVNTLLRGDGRERRRRASSPAAIQLARALREQERRVALVEVPRRRARCPSARSARTPPTPRISSWCSRISRPRTYRMCVIGRSAGSLTGLSVSSSSTGTRPTWTVQTSTFTLAPGQLDRRRSAGRPRARARA